MKTWQILLIISLDETELLNHDRQGDWALQPWFELVLNFLKNLHEFILTNLCVLLYSISIVIDYNSFWDLNFFFLECNILWKKSTTSIFETYFWIRRQQKDFFWKHLRMKNNEGLSQKPNELRYFCMDLIKEQLLKHWFDLNMKAGLKL